jgi:hypothetical protein
VNAAARVYWGDWIADCPAGCGNAEFVLPGKPFFCTPEQGGCGISVHVDWPEDAPMIEELLNRRPLKRNRNWFPGESVGELAIENLNHGIM